MTEAAYLDNCENCGERRQYDLETDSMKCKKVPDADAWCESTTNQKTTTEGTTTAGTTRTTNPCGIHGCHENERCDRGLNLFQLTRLN